jgi:hypothetical protein
LTADQLDGVLAQIQGLSVKPKGEELRRAYVPRFVEALIEKNFNREEIAKFLAEQKLGISTTQVHHAYRDAMKRRGAAPPPAGNGRPAGGAPRSAFEKT